MIVKYGIYLSQLDPDRLLASNNKSISTIKVNLEKANRAVDEILDSLGNTTMSISSTTISSTINTSISLATKTSSSTTATTRSSSTSTSTSTQASSSLTSFCHFYFFSSFMTLFMPYVICTSS